MVALFGDTESGKSSRRARGGGKLDRLKLSAEVMLTDVGRGGKFRLETHTVVVMNR